MERYVRNARFCLICNYVSKIIPALQSRCTRFRFQPLPEQFVRTRLDYIAAKEWWVGRAGGRWPEGGGLRRGWHAAACPTESCWLGGTASSFSSGPAARLQPSGQALTPPSPAATPPRSIKVLPGGLEALIELGCGDMRRTLNLLQSTVMSGGGEVGEGAVYACAGKPLPAEIEEVANWLLNEPLKEAFLRIAALQRHRGMALVDCLQQLHPFVFRIGMPPGARVELVSKMAAIEHRLANGVSERLQLGALCGAFAEAREAIVAAAR